MNNVNKLWGSSAGAGELYAQLKERHNGPVFKFSVVSLLVFGALTSTSLAKSASNFLYGSLIINPGGMVLGYERRFGIESSSFYFALYDRFYVYSNEVGMKIGYRAENRWLDWGLGWGLEPGFYRKAPSSTSRGSAVGNSSLDRSFGWRGNLKSVATVNLEWGFFRLYSRSSLGFRYRDFIEQDTFQGLNLENELWVEQALAPMFALSNHLKGYVEYTVGSLISIDTRPNRVSTGLLIENWPNKGLTLNLDLFYSLAPSPIDGFGTIISFWKDY